MVSSQRFGTKRWRPSNHEVSCSLTLVLRLSAREVEAEFVGAFEDLFGRTRQASGYFGGTLVLAGEAAEFLLGSDGPRMS